MNKKQSRLIHDFIIAKELEEKAKKGRIAIEEKIAKAFPSPEEKQTTITEDDYKIIIDRTYSYKINDEAYRAAVETIPEEYQCHRVKLELEKKKYDSIMELAPNEIKKIISDCVEAKPKKVAVKIEVI